MQNLRREEALFENEPERVVAH